MKQRLNNGAASLKKVDAAFEALDMSVVPRALGSLFTKPPLIPGEDEQAYDELLSLVTTAIKPNDPIEELWVKDVVDLVWEAQRLRRLKASLLMVGRKKALEKILDLAQVRELFSFGDPHSTSNLASQWLANDKHAVAEVRGILKDRGLDADSIMAQALSDKLREVERIDTMIASADTRRNKTLVEIERRRDTVARRLRTIADDVTNID